MAEDEREWRKRHAHEAQIATYGSAGLATYDKGARQWHFLRNVFNEDNGTNDPQIFRVLTGHELVIEGTSQDRRASSEGKFSSPSLIRRYPQTAPADSIIAELVREKPTSPSPIEGNLFGHGTARWLGADGQDSGNLTASISAFVCGSGQNELVLACVGKKTVEFIGVDNPQLHLRTPSFVGTVQTSWYGQQRLLQIASSCSSKSGDRNTFLAVRQASRTTIFEPYLRRDEYTAESADHSSLDCNPLLSIDRSVTGEQDHADVCFHPIDQRRLALIDVQGNWSTWKITGQRQNTAHRLHRAHLEAAGKIFSWQYKSRPPGVDLYFDGWHKILWTSSDSSSIDRILVCNRHHAKLFDLQGRAVRWVDVRLDTKKENSYILDAMTGPISSICYVLTTTSILIFDLAQDEPKDIGGSPGPALLCAVPHFFRSTALKLTGLNFIGDVSTLAIYGRYKHEFKILNIEFAIVNEQRLVSMTNLSLSELLGTLPKESIKSIKFQPVETAPSSMEVVELMIHYEDLSISSATLLLSQLKAAGPIMRLPPIRSSKSKSARLVDSIEDEDDLAGFIVFDENDSRTMNSPGLEEYEEFPSAHQTSQAVATKLLQRALADALAVNRDTESKPDVQAATEAFELALNELSGLNSVETLNDLFATNCRIYDIEPDYSAIERSLDTARELTSNRLLYSSARPTDSGTVLGVYEEIFAQFVECLPAHVPDRVRVARERRNRNIALELNLSNQTVRQRSVIERSQADKSTAPLIQSDPIMFSDPIHPQQSSIPTINEISASQPNAQITDTSPGSNAQPSPLPGILSRLSAYTTISNPPAPILIEDKSISKSMDAILSHLPTTIDVDPSTYDWQAAELANAGIDASAGRSASNTQSSRRHSKLADASKRAGNIRQPTHPSKLKNQISDVDLPPMTLRQNQSRKLASTQLPLSDGYDLASSQTVVHDSMSTGQNESSSAIHDQITSTQPERGVFGSRVNVGKPKKKKRRLAGF